MDEFPQEFESLGFLLVRDVETYFRDFFLIARANSTNVKSDPVIWAHAQTHAMIRDFVDPKAGYQPFVTVRDWIMDYCVGAWKADDRVLKGSLEEFERSFLRVDWRASAWLRAYACERHGSLSDVDAPLEKQSEEETQKVLEVLCKKFWRDVESELAHQARLVRIEVAKAGVFASVAATEESSRTRKPKPLNKFQITAGELMHKARLKEPKVLEDTTITEICTTLDREGFDLRENLEGVAKRRLAEWNQKNPRKAIHAWALGIKAKGGSHFVPRAIKRTLYRAQEKWGQQYEKLSGVRIADKN